MPRPLVGYEIEPEILADRVLVREVLACHGLTDDRDVRRVGAVVIVEIAAALKRDTHHREIVWRHRRIAGPLQVGDRRTRCDRRRQRPAVDDERNVERQAGAERSGGYRRHRLYARHGAQPLTDALDGVRRYRADLEQARAAKDPRSLERITGRQPEVECQNVRRIGAKLVLECAHEAMDHQAGADEQHEGERDLAAHEHAAHASSLDAAGCATVRVARGIHHGDS